MNETNSRTPFFNGSTRLLLAGGLMLGLPACQAVEGLEASQHVDGGPFANPFGDDGPATCSADPERHVFFGADAGAEDTGTEDEDDTGTEDEDDTGTEDEETDVVTDSDTNVFHDVVVAYDDTVLETELAVVTFTGSTNYAPAEPSAPAGVSPFAKQRGRVQVRGNSVFIDGTRIDGDLIIVQNNGDHVDINVDRLRYTTRPPTRPARTKRQWCTMKFDCPGKTPNFNFGGYFRSVSDMKGTADAFCYSEYGAFGNTGARRASTSTACCKPAKYPKYTSYFEHCAKNGSRFQCKKWR